MDTPKILYEDDALLVCVKPHGVPTQSKNIGARDLESILKNHIASAKGRSSDEPYLAVIHRLDQPVSGVLVFAKTPEAAKRLNAQLQRGDFGKYYRALTDGRPEEPSGILRHYLVKDGRTNTSRVCNPGSPGSNGAKEAILEYKVIEEGYFFKDAGDGQCELEIHLHTGRHHQIRVQLASAGFPIAGDTKYNAAAKTAGGWQILKLCACHLQFTHPFTKKILSFELSEDVNG